MPFVEYDVKLDFKDVLFRPKRSSLKSRSQVLDYMKRGFLKSFLGRAKKRVQVSKFGQNIQWRSNYGCKHGHDRNL